MACLDINQSLCSKMNNKTYTDLTCRVCLNVEELMVNIYEEVEDLQSNLVELLESCGGLMVDRSDNLPKYLCKVCAEELLVAAKFREKCSKSNELLIQMMPRLDEGEVAVDVLYEVETNPFIAMTEEILNEIIIEEVEDKVQTTNEWCENAQIEDESENIIIESPDHELQNEVTDKIEDQNLIINEHDQMIDTKPKEQSEEELIISDKDETGYVVETITKKKLKMKMRKKSQSSAPMKFHCDACGAAFFNHENLNRHLRTHSEFAGIVNTCQYCLHPFTTMESLQVHYDTSHPSDTTPVIYSKKQNILNSETCETCGKVFKTKSNLRVHLRIHTGDRPYPCSECSKTFKTQAALTLHQKRHAGQFDYECEVCGKLFVESSNLTVHMRTHTGEKPHPCKLCGKKFSRVFLLQLHLRTHTGEKPYKCEMCNKAYSQKCDLSIHMRTHTGARPYVCPICFRGFVKNHALQKHLQLHPKEEVK